VSSLALKKMNNGGAVPFGMCLTGNHDRCHRSYWDDRGKAVYCQCQCENHGVNYVAPPGASALALELMEKYYGPRKPHRPRPHETES
jgi:hypothetical protein